MKIIKLIDLLVKIANGEEVPNKIKIGTHIFTKYNYSKGDGTFVSNYESNNDGELYINDFLYPQYLNDEVEIIEEEKKIPEKEDELIRYNIQDFDNLKEFVEITTNDVFGKINKIIDTTNQLIDYLKSKGE